MLLLLQGKKKYMPVGGRFLSYAFAFKLIPPMFTEICRLTNYDKKVINFVLFSRFR